MRLETAKSLHDILSACQKIEAFTARSSREQYSDDEALQFIVERLLMTVGEATSRISHSDPEIANLIPEHQRIIGLRNRIAHEYDEIDNDIIWDIAVTRAPTLRVTVAALLATAGPSQME